MGGRKKTPADTERFTEEKKFSIHRVLRAPRASV